MVGVKGVWSRNSNATDCHLFGPRLDYRWCPALIGPIVNSGAPSRIAAVRAT